MATFTAAVRFMDGSKGVFTVDDVPDHETARAALIAEYPLRTCLVALEPEPLSLELGPREVA